MGFGQLASGRPGPLGGPQGPTWFDVASLLCRVTSSLLAPSLCSSRAAPFVLAVTLSHLCLTSSKALFAGTSSEWLPLIPL